MPALTPSPRQIVTRPTLRDVAMHLGISTSTVSLALRGSPNIATDTRAQVLRAAETLGYRPNPEISKLMSHLRAGWAPGFKSTLFALTSRPETQFSEYHAELVHAARQRANELGYGFVLRHFDPATVHRRTLLRTLVNQGIQGVLLLPMAAPIDCGDLLDWSRFSVVSATYGVRSPEFDRVVPHQFNNLRKACAALAKLGYQRIGLIHNFDLSIMVNHSFLAAVATQNILGPTQPVAPYFYKDNFPDGLRSWFERERPDALIVDGESIHRQTMRELDLGDQSAIGFALTDRERNSALSGIDENGAGVGRAAIEKLAFKIQTGDQGIPAEPSVTMIEGKWMRTASLAPQIPQQAATILA